MYWFDKHDYSPHTKKVFEIPFLNQRLVVPLPTFLGNAGVAKLVDVPDLGSGAERHGGSSPSARTLLSPPYLFIFNNLDTYPWLSAPTLTTQLPFLP